MLALLRLGLFAAGGQQEQLEGFPPGDVPGGAERAVRVAVHHLLLVQREHVLVRPVGLGQVGKGGSQIRDGLGGRAECDRHQDGQEGDCQTFFHGFSFSPGGVCVLLTSILQNSTPYGNPRERFYTFEKFAKYP